MDLQWFAREPTEPATPRRLEQARQRGQVLRSQEVVAAATLLGALAALALAGRLIWHQWAALAREVWGGLAPLPLGEGQVRGLLLRAMAATALGVAPVALAVLAAGLLANYLQVGFLFSLAPLAPDLGRVNPLAGLQRLFSRRALVELVQAALKAGLYTWVAVQALRGHLPALAGLTDLGAPALLARVAQLAAGLLWRLALAEAAVALLDYLYQRFDYLRSLRMTKQEVKEELRETEGSPEVRGRIRKRQRELARRRMMQEVRRADVVITNPTHYAVALRYRQGEMVAPQVVAKGAGYVALKIRQVAEAAGVPVVENPPLARSLYDAVDIGRVIPPALYQAVAEVLAYVYRMQGRVPGGQGG